MTISSIQQIRIANDTGLLISEVEEYIALDLIQYSQEYKKYYLSNKPL